MSSREIWTQRSQYTHDQLPLSDREIIIQQYRNQVQNHPHSEASKHKNQNILKSEPITVGDLVYLYGDRDKSRARNRYLVVSVEGEWCFVKKFVGNSLRASSYKVKTSECYRVPVDKTLTDHRYLLETYDSDDEVETVPSSPVPPPQTEVPDTLSYPEDRLSDPVLLTPSRPLDSSNFDGVTHIPISVASPAEPQILQENEHPHEHPHEPCPNQPINQRPQRISRPPKYLEDYVLK